MFNNPIITTISVDNFIFNNIHKKQLIVVFHAYSYAISDHEQTVQSLNCTFYTLYCTYYCSYLVSTVDTSAM